MALAGGALAAEPLPPAAPLAAAFRAGLNYKFNWAPAPVVAKY